MLPRQRITLSASGLAGDEQKTWFHLLFGAPNDNGMYNIFLNFVDPDFRTAAKRADYLSFKVPLIRPLSLPLLYPFFTLNLDI